MTKLPLAVYLMVTSWTCGGDIVAKSWLRPQQRDSGDNRPSLLMPRLARSTNKLGLGGLAPAAASMSGGVDGGGSFLLAFACIGFLAGGGGGGACLRASTALDSCWRESWIFCRSSMGEVLIEG